MEVVQALSAWRSYKRALQTIPRMGDRVDARWGMPKDDGQLANGSAPALRSPQPDARQGRSKYPMPDPQEEAPDRRAGAPSRQSKVRKGQTSASYELRAPDMFQPNDGFPVPRMPTVGRQTPQLCARKVGPNEARSLSLTFGKGELNLGIAQSPSMRRVKPNSAPLRQQ